MSPSSNVKTTAALLVTCFCVFFTGLPAQKLAVKKLLFESITIDDGLSQGMVTRILQDRYGFMWFATKDGLNRYDGYNFVVYRHDARNRNSLADNFVGTIFEDSKGRLWVGTASQGLDLFNRETETFIHFRLDKADPASICDNSILDISEDKEGIIYVSTPKGLCKIAGSVDENRKEKFSFQVIDSAPYCKVFPFHKNQVWIAPSGNWPYSITKNKQTALRTDIFPGKDSKGLPNRDILKNVGAFSYDSIRHIVYFICDAGIVRYDENNNRYETISDNSFSLYVLSNPSLVDSSGTLWMSDLGRLVQYNIHNRTSYLIETDNKVHRLMISSANCIFQDRSGVVWIGTAGYGLLKYNARAEKFHRTGEESVRWLKEDRNGKIMVIMKGDVAWLFDRKKGNFTGCVPDTSFIRKNNFTPTLDAVEQDDDGIYWLGKQKFMRYDPVKKRAGFTTFDRDFSFPLCLDKDGLTWMGTNNSFCSYNKKTKKFTHYPFPFPVSNEPYKFIQAITQQNDSLFWLGTVSGLVRFNKNTAGWKRYNNNPNDTTSLSFDVIFSIYADPVHPDLYLWIGTNGGGFNRFELASEKFLRYSTSDGLPNDVVYGILSDAKDNLWMSTNKGLSRFDPATKRFHNYEAKDGLQSNEFNRYAFCKTSDGTLFFGGVNGFNYFNPEELSSNANLPAIVITDFKIGNKPVNIHSKGSSLGKPIYLTGKITLPYEDNMISFDFAAMDFSQPQKNLYQYKLEGFDKEWIQSGTHHSATYTNLDPGTYTFRVRGSNSDGFWNEAGTSLQITILPPWFMTWWFRGAATLLLLFVGYAFYRYRLLQALKLHAVRNRIASDLHDEIGSNMSNILIFSNIAHQKVEKANETAPLLKKITEYTQLSMEAMSDIVWMINTRNDRFGNIIIRMHTVAAELFESTPSSLHMHFDDKLNLVKLSMEERKNFYLIYKEAITNVSKYAGCQHVWIDLELKQGQVILNVSDNGKGFNVNDAGNGNGLFNMRARAKMLKGKLTIASTPGAGTSIQLSFKVS